MSFRITTLLALSLWFCLSTFVASNSWADKPLRVASMGLCTDQLLIQLLKPEQIVSLSSLATDSTWSFYADQAQQLHKPTSTLETLIALKPALILGTHYSRFEEVEILRKLSMNVKTIKLPNAYNEIPAMIKKVGEWTQENKKAEQLIKQSRTKLARIKKSIKGKPALNAFIFSPNGYTIGANTIEDDVMRLAGYNNLAAQSGIEGFKQLSLEKVVINQPDVILIDNLALNSNSQANQLLFHPALASVSKNNTKLFVPKNMRSCAGTMTTDAIAYLVENR